MASDAQVKAWQRAHPEKMREYRAKWSAANREKELKAKRDWWNKQKYGKKTRPGWASRVVGNIGRKLKG